MRVGCGLPNHINGAAQQEEGSAVDNPQVYGIVVASSISKSVEPNEELKVEQILPQVLSTTDTTLRMLNVRFT